MKQGWKIKKLGDVCDIINGFAFKSNLFTDEGENILRISNIQNGYVDLADIAHFNKTDYPKINFEKYAVLEDDIVVALSGATTGKFGINKTGQKLYLNQRVAICRENTPTLNHLYLLYYLKTQAKSFLESAEGVAQPNLSTEQMKQYDIPIPSREEQERIVEELDCLSGVIEKKREQLRELDALAQSIFYTMFGDPITNEKGWKVNTIGNLAEFYNGVAHEGSISEYGQYDVVNSKFISTQGGIRKHCDLQMFPLLKNDIVMVMSDVPNGKALAKCYLIEADNKYTLNQRICAFRNYNNFNPIFLYYYLNRHPYYLRFDDGNGQTNLRRIDVLNCPVYIPPIHLQQEFADKIEAIEKQKELIKQSITQIEELFNARMDYYFN